MEIHALRMPAFVEPDRFARLLKAVSPERRDRVLRFRHGEDALRCLFGDLLVRHVLTQTTGARNRDLVFSRDGGGKPVCLIPGAPHYNLSHSGCWVLAAFDDLPVGVDVERIKPVDPGVVMLTLSHAELEMMESLPENERRAYFYDIWVLKESRLKASGSGLTDSLASYSVSPTGEPFRFRINDGGDADGYYLSLLPGFDPAYRAAVCFGREGAVPIVTDHDPKELADFFLLDP